MRFSPQTDGKEWCEQCETQKSAPAARACKSQFCKLKDLLPPEQPYDFQPIDVPIATGPSIVSRREHARIIKGGTRTVTAVAQLPRSGKRAARAIRGEDGLTPKARRLLEEMKRRGDKRTGEVAISFNDVFADTGCSSPAVVKGLMQDLIDRKHVTIIQPGRGRSKTRYLIHGFAEKPPLGEPAAEPEFRIIAGLRVQILAEECGICRFAKFPKIGHMICKRLPPHPKWGQPTVTSDGWCGEFQKAHRKT